MLRSYRVIIWVVVIILFLNLMFKTLTDSDFINWGGKGLSQVFTYHYRYPEEIIIFILFTLLPAIYYTVIRGNVFYEFGLTVNKGMPFLNQKVMYDRVENYNVANFKNLVVLKTKSDMEVYLQSHDTQRIIGILDQHEIKGDLGKRESIESKSSNRKLFIVFVMFSILVFLFQHFGWTKYLVR